MRFLLLGFLIACGDDSGTPPPIDTPGPTDTMCIPGATHVVFLNRTGGTYTKSTTTDDDSRTNVSTVIAADVTLPAPTVTDPDWAAFKSCVASKFAPFAIEITDVDPGTADHVELVVIDTPQQIGQQTGVGSVSPFNCHTLFNAIPFVMWAGLTNPDRCWTGAQTLGTAFGLDHALSCPDLMTFQTGCGANDAKTFTDESVGCGETTARDCACRSKASQNSFSYLTGAVGTSCL